MLTLNIPKKIEFIIHFEFVCVKISIIKISNSKENFLKIETSNAIKQQVINNYCPIPIGVFLNHPSSGMPEATYLKATYV